MLPDQTRLVLLVDNEEALRKLSRRILEKAGYTVLLARNSREALGVSRDYSGQIDLLLSDIEMPGMNGIALANQITAERPGIAVLLTSGNPAYAEETRFAFLAQPYNPQKLQIAVAQSLEIQAQSFAAVELEVDPTLVMEGSSSPPKISTSEMQSAETNGFVRAGSPRASTPDRARRHLSGEVLDSDPRLPKEAAQVPGAHRNSSKIDSSALSTSARNLAIAFRERLSRWRLPHAVPVWAQVAAALVLAIAPFGLHQFEERRAAYGVWLQAVRGLAGEAEAPTGTPLILNLDVSSLPRSAAYKLQIVNEDGHNIWQKVIAAKGSEVHTKSASLRPGIYFVRVYEPTGELLKEYELRVIQKH